MNYNLIYFRWLMTTQIESNNPEKDSFFTRKPGYLIQKGGLILHTKAGMGYGRQLLQIAERLRSLWQSANADNPFADLYLLQLEDAMITTKSEFDQKEQTYQQQLIKYPDIQLQLVTSQKPLTMPLHFLNIYSFRIAILIGHFDRIARYALSLHHLNFDTQVPLSQIMKELGAPLRKLFEIGWQWKEFNVTRTDIMHDNELAKAAKEHFKINIDPRILSGEIRPQLVARKKISIPLTNNTAIKQAEPHNQINL